MAKNCCLYSESNVRMGEGEWCSLRDRRWRDVMRKKKKAAAGDGIKH